MADGQNYLETNNITDNLNFTVFEPKYFSNYEQATSYATNIILGKYLST